MPALSGIEFHQRPMRRLVYRVDRKNAQRPADRRLDPDCCGLFHQAQEKLHGMLAQPLAFPGQPFTEVAVPQRKTIEQVSPIQPGRPFQCRRRVLRDRRPEGGKVGFDHPRREADRARICFQKWRGASGGGQQLTQIAARLGIRHVLPQQHGDPVARDPLPGRRGKKRQQGDGLPGAERNLLPVRSAQLEPAQKIDAPAVHPAHRDADPA
jgi:hypothetical protein